LGAHSLTKSSSARRRSLLDCPAGRSKNGGKKPLGGRLAGSRVVSTRPTLPPGRIEQARAFRRALHPRNARRLGFASICNSPGRTASFRFPGGRASFPPGGYREGRARFPGGGHETWETEQINPRASVLAFHRDSGGEPEPTRSAVESRVLHSDPSLDSWGSGKNSPNFSE